MQYTCPNPACGTPYRIADKVLGQRFTCKKCGAALVMAEEGLQLAEGPALAAFESAEGPGDSSLPAPQFVRREPLSSSLKRKLADLDLHVPTWLFGTGAIFSILFLFLPVIDQMKVLRASALLEQGDARLRRMQEDQQFRPIERPGGEADKTSEEARKKFADAKEKWDKEKVELQKDADEVRTSARRSIYWYAWGMLLGFLLLAGGCLGYIQPNEAGVRRITGSVVLCGLLLMIFFAYVVFSAAAMMSQR